MCVCQGGGGSHSCSSSCPSPSSPSFSSSSSSPSPAASLSLSPLPSSLDAFLSLPVLSRSNCTVPLAGASTRRVTSESRSQGALPRSSQTESGLMALSWLPFLSIPFEPWVGVGQVPKLLQS
uniref:Uncharacterized protein n=1 Tax=Physcomitrium patens TaxID=3218 RepID=A0A2K1KD94_PHYPA|nr:hypothetical protein PHYPA_010938 [Physcomitrium patens]